MATSLTTAPLSPLKAAVLPLSGSTKANPSPQSLSSPVCPSRRRLDCCITAAAFFCCGSMLLVRAVHATLCTSTSPSSSSSPPPSAPNAPLSVAWPRRHALPLEHPAAWFPCARHCVAQLAHILWRVRQVPWLVSPADAWIAAPIGTVFLWLLCTLLLPARLYTWRARAALAGAVTNSSRAFAAVALLAAPPGPWQVQSYWAAYLRTEIISHAWFAFSVPVDFGSQLVISSLQALTALVGCVTLAGRGLGPPLLPTLVGYAASSAFGCWVAYRGSVAAGAPAAPHRPVGSPASADPQHPQGEVITSAAMAVAPALAPTPAAAHKAVAQCDGCREDPHDDSAQKAQALVVAAAAPLASLPSADRVELSLLAAQHHLRRRPLLYVTPTRRTSVYCKISGFEPSNLPAFVPLALGGAVASVGCGHLVHVAVRSGCIELVLDAVVFGADAACGARARRGPAATAAAILRGVRLDWADGTNVTVFCNRQPYSCTFDAAKQAWSVSAAGGRAIVCEEEDDDSDDEWAAGGGGGCGSGAEIACVPPSLWHVRPLCAALPSDGRCSGVFARALGSGCSGGGGSGRLAAAAARPLRLAVFCTDAWGSPKPVEDITPVATANGRFFDVRVHLAPDGFGAPCGAGSPSAKGSFSPVSGDGAHDADVSSSYDSSRCSLAAEAVQVLLVEVLGCGDVAGLLRLELLHKGRPSGSRDVLLVPDAAVAWEVAELEVDLQAAREKGDEDALQVAADVIHDLGLFIALVDQTLVTVLEAGGQQLLPPAAEVTGWMDTSPSPAYVADMLQVASHLLPFCCERGWTHTVDHLVEGVRVLLASGGGDGAQLAAGAGGATAAASSGGRAAAVASSDAALWRGAIAGRERSAAAAAAQSGALPPPAPAASASATSSMLPAGGAAARAATPCFAAELAGRGRVWRAAVWPVLCAAVAVSCAHSQVMERVGALWTWSAAAVYLAGHLVAVANAIMARSAPGRRGGRWQLWAAAARVAAKLAVAVVGAWAAADSSGDAGQAAAVAAAATSRSAASSWRMCLGIAAEALLLGDLDVALPWALLLLVLDAAAASVMLLPALGGGGVAGTLGAMLPEVAPRICLGLAVLAACRTRTWQRLGL